MGETAPVLIDIPGTSAVKNNSGRQMIFSRSFNMKHAAVILVAIGFVLFSCSVFAAEVETGQICTAVVERACEGAGTAFPADVGKVYAFTRVLGMDSGSSITHRWIFRDRNMAEVELDIGGPDWRTWSSKKIDSLWSGDWRVEIVDNSDSSVIDIMEFSIEQ
jgi:hypothetical protein